MPKPAVGIKPHDLGTAPVRDDESPIRPAPCSAVPGALPPPISAIGSGSRVQAVSAVHAEPAVSMIRTPALSLVEYSDGSECRAATSGSGAAGGLCTGAGGVWTASSAPAEAGSESPPHPDTRLADSMAATMRWVADEYFGHFGV